MNTLIVYDSQYGNTERIALSIADTLREYGQVRAIHVDPAQPIALQGIDLLIVGSPTQGWNATPVMKSTIKHLASEQFQRMAVACFDTRFHKPRWLTGSAASMIAKDFQSAGVSLLTPPESFFVKGAEGPLETGELERSATWARMLATKVGAPQPAMP